MPMDYNIQLMSAFSTGKLESIFTDSMKKRFSLKGPESTSPSSQASQVAPTRTWGAHYSSGLREASETVKATARADENFAEIQETLVAMQDIAQRIKDGQYEGEFTELPEGEGYEEAMQSLIDSAPQDATEPAEGEIQHIGMMAREFSAMADKINHLLEETLAEDRELLRDHVYSGQEPTFTSIKEITLSNSIDGTLQDLSGAITETLETRGELEATATTAQHDMAQAVDKVNQSYRMAGGQAPEQVPDASDLVAKIRQMLTQSPSMALGAQADERYMPPAEMLAGMIY